MDFSWITNSTIFKYLYGFKEQIIQFITTFAPYIAGFIFFLVCMRIFTKLRYKKSVQTQNKGGTDEFPLQLGIYVHIGKQGSGKSYSMVKQGLIAITKGLKVYANFAMEGTFRYENLTDLLNIQDSIILCDEVYQQMSSRNSKRNAKELEDFIPQIRKRNCILIATAQSFDQIKKTFKEQTREIYHHWNGKEKFWGALLAYIFGVNYGYEEIYEPQNFGKVNRHPIYKGYFRFDSKIFKCYDTNEIIGFTGSGATNLENQGLLEKVERNEKGNISNKYEEIRCKICLGLLENFSVSDVSTICVNHSQELLKILLKDKV